MFCVATPAIPRSISSWREQKSSGQAVTLKRWARRLLDYEFTYEDAKVLSLGTFGTNQTASRLGVSAIITLDTHFINNLHARGDVIRRRVRAMTTQLAPLYDQAVLPDFHMPVEALQRLLV